MEENIKIDENLSIPKHIAIIMDGNGRWAKKMGKLRVFGHKEGVKAARRAIDCASSIGVDFLTLYTFSTENWNRPKFEVNALMSLLVSTLSKELKSLQEKNIRVKVVGNINQLPEKARNAMFNGIEETKNNTGMTLLIALSYSGRQEIINAVNTIIESGLKRVTEEEFPDFLYTGNIPDPDLLIRTGGEYRISNFLLWQIAYSEIKVFEKFWPEFTEQDLIDAVKEYSNRERRFGKTSEQLNS